MAAEQLDPLLAEQQAPWEAVEDLESGENYILLKQLFAPGHSDVVKILQKQGVAKLGEFRESTDLVYAAFDGAPIITVGSQQRSIDVERMWRAKLRAGRPKPTGWSAEATVEAYVVSIPDAADPDKDGLLQPLLRQYQSGAVSIAVFGLPAVQAVIDHKWQQFARRLLLWELAIFVCWLLSFYGFTWLFQDEDWSLSLSELVSTQRGALSVAFEIIALVAMTPFVILEAGTLSAYGISGWFNIWNALDIMTYAIQFTVTACHLSRRGLDSNYLSVLLALQCVFLLFRSQYYSRVFKSTRFAFLEAVRDVIKEIKFYFVFLLIIIFGFAAAFHVLFRKDQKRLEHFDTFPHSFLTVYAGQAGLDYDEMLSSSVPVAAACMNVIYAFVMGMVLVNLLIGIMSNALEKVTQHEALKLLLHKAQIIDELEATMPRWLEDKFEGSWYPKWIHILRIDPESQDKVDLEAIWSGGAENDKDEGGDGGSNKGKEGDSNGEIAAIKQHLTALTTDVSVQLAAIQAQLAKLTENGSLSQTTGGGGRKTNKK